MADFKFFGKNEDAFERVFDEAERLEAANERFERMLQLHFPSDGLPALLPPATLEIFKS